MAVKVGDMAPDFTLTSQTGESVSLKDFQGKKSVVLYFYPKDDTPGCTAEACGFRDSYQVFKDAGAEVIGISSDSTQSHQQFVKKYNLPFILLSDTGNKVRQLYGVPAALWILPGRVTYIIDKDGVVRHLFDSMLEFQRHVDEALTTLKTIAVS
ncbi:Peroxiredoxin Q, chloroplastic [Planktothrix tepida]|uniref:thioredoxin-dependent peroxiredoxin n=2 Tax=Planktothrix TaxID=54304 RepID=A0A1J1LJ94_9CYAN|nr:MULTISPECIES: peroxiredoxin [Planktothrix]CAD5950716.1 Peroxiredoxin Q, chloroplastic [Planktothrix tepida]CAD5960042.1 Peroxiredoxin Q, chloroplastic [Planktothrix pseudagardhii]CUR32584.1 Alkyl hydroperoxide reductase/ Thiol specific antioxidant/ Malallergen [Planktothrix tepida PCC 9214]